MSNISKRRKEGSRAKIKTMGDHKDFLKRITKTLYYGQLPALPCLSLPVTEVSCSVWSEWQLGRSVRRLHADAAARVSLGARVSPCALVIALLYLERLRATSPEYLANTHPHHLFLVSLMIGNKFLQDDGEDEEVFVSEWASSGGIDTDHLKKLELDFLIAIDWNIFVSEKSFETGLQWLEKQVALRQAALRGFFTYGDLAASYEPGALANEVLKAISSACATISLAYFSGVITLVTSTLVISHAWLPALRLAAASTDIAASSHKVNHAPLYFNNSGFDLPIINLAEDVVIDIPKCCTKWTKFQEQTVPKKNWYDGIVVDNWKIEPWWSTTSMTNWLYQSALINPMQRWLEIINEYGEFFLKELKWESSKDRCEEYVKPGENQHCVRQSLNLSKLTSLVVSVSDR